MKPIIFGLAGEELSPAEREFLEEIRPCGIILFKRNIRTPEQVANLTKEIRLILGANRGLILIDQEGGRVQRLGPPHWRQIPPAGYFAEIAGRDTALGRSLLRASIRRMATELRSLGINTDCLPVLDVPVPGAHDIIGDRALGRDSTLVADLGAVVVDALAEAGVLPVIKHIPGHGRATADSHEELPVVDAALDELQASDFRPFRALRHAPLAMTAHVVYRAIDPGTPATWSKKVVSDIIRGEIGFEGLLMSDDLGMNALSGSMAERALKSLEAGVDLVCHCCGDLDEMLAVADVVPPMGEPLERRVTELLAAAGGQETMDLAALTAQYDELILGAEGPV